MQARDIMTVAVVTATPETRIDEVAKRLIDKRISAVPVVDADNRVVGLVSEGDILRRVAGRDASSRAWWLRLMALAEEPRAEPGDPGAVAAGEVMTTDVVTVGPETPVTEIAELLERRHIKRVPVVDGGRLVGIVSRANLLHALALPGAGRDEAEMERDRDARSRILERLGAIDPARAHLINVVVSGGVAHVWGAADTEEEMEARRLLTESLTGIEGVEEVENRTGLLQSAIAEGYWVGR